MYALVADEHRYTISEPDHGGGEWSHQGDYGVIVYPRRLHRRENSRFDLGYHEAVAPSSVEYACEDIEIGGTAHVVVVTYTDGGTFGSDGCWVVASVRRSYEDAQADMRAAHDPQPKGHYRPWDGYFASLSDVDIFTTTVRA